ncbi:MAG: hypothetical protein QOE70_99 [Chthoniobacter sp.]|jgi:lysophospholipase L1-like esterase|nr:hypothetical protein [Chthoniobacter sp.]
MKLPSLPLIPFCSVVLFLGFTSVLAPQALAKPPAKSTVQQADESAPKLGPDGQPQPDFLAKHEQFVALAKAGTAKCVFLGDSITAGWGANQPIWDKTFGSYAPVNFGIGGDRTQHVLWRIENGELDGIKPKALVLMIGTNNSSSDKPEETARGVRKIVQTILKKTPSTKVLLLAIFPRGEKATPPRETNQKVNKIISRMADNRTVFFLDIGEKFLQPDGSISKEIMPDLLHLTPAGYQIWADAIAPKLAELMK